jgi:hypothetical protein
MQADFAKELSAIDLAFVFEIPITRSEQPKCARQTSLRIR